MMQLILMRHGKAVQVGEQGVRRDAERMLSDKGRRQAIEVGTGLLALGCRPERIVTSPLVRAAETADLVAQTLGTGIAVERCDRLASGMSSREGVSWLAEQPPGCLLLVGHMPDFSDLAGALLGCTSQGAVGFKTGGICSLSLAGRVREGAANLDWLLQPSQMRALLRA